MLVRNIALSPSAGVVRMGQTSRNRRSNHAIYRSCLQFSTPASAQKTPAPSTTKKFSPKQQPAEKTKKPQGHDDKKVELEQLTKFYNAAEKTRRLVIL